MVASDAVLDNPIWAALSGPQARFAQALGRAARFQPDVSPFAGLADPADGDAWRDLATVAGPGQEMGLSALRLRPPSSWEIVRSLAALQLVGDRVSAGPDPAAVALTAADVPEMLDLVARTRPGPFRKRTVDLGAYVGVRHGGELVAMAGERLRMPGFTEISAVCTDPAHRGRGLAARLIGTVAAGIRERGDVPFLAVVADNDTAVRVYRRLGFTVRADVTFTIVRTPAGT